MSSHFLAHSPLISAKICGSSAPYETPGIGLFKKSTFPNVFLTVAGCKAVATFLMKLFTTKICQVLQGITRGEGCFQLPTCLKCLELDTLPQSECVGLVSHTATTIKKTAPQIISNYCIGLFTLVSTLVTS